MPATARAQATVVPLRPTAGGEDAWTDEVAAFVLNRRARNASPVTLASYRQALGRWEAFMRARGRSLDPAAATRRDVDAFLASMLAAGNRPATVAQRFAVLRAFFRHLLDVEAIPSDPTAKVSAPTVEVAPVPVVSPVTLDRLLAATAGRSFLDLRDRAIILLLADTGIRRGEVAAIMLEDLSLEDGFVVVHGKGGRTRPVPFGPITADALGGYLRARRRHQGAEVVESRTVGKWTRQGQPLFLARDSRMGAGWGLIPEAVNQVLARRCAQAGIPRVHPHQFRHTWADAMLTDGATEGDTATLGGWRNRRMLDRYGAAGRERRAMAAYRSPVSAMRRKGGR